MKLISRALIPILALLVCSGIAASAQPQPPESKQPIDIGAPTRNHLKQALKSDALKTQKDFSSLFPAELVKRFGTDKAKYGALYGPNLGYVYVPHGGKQFVIDADAQSIGIPNNDVRLLDKCVELLQKPSEAAKARRVLKRYTALSFPSAAAWQAWLKKNRANISFYDQWDYRFFAGPAGPALPETQVQYVASTIELPEPSDEAPVSTGTAVATHHYIKNSTSSQKGAPMAFLLRMKIAHGWHTYARMPDDTGEETKIEIELPKGFHWIGEWQNPASHEGTLPGAAEYTGDVLFRRSFYVTDEAGKGLVQTKLQGTVYYQVCNAEGCLPPASMRFEIPLTVH